VSGVVHGTTSVRNAGLTTLGAVEIGPNDVFLVVDVQVDFTTGSMAVPGAAAIIEPINATAARFDHVVIVTDWHPRGHVSFATSHAGLTHGDSVTVAYGEQRVWNDHCVQGSEGAQLDPRLDLDKAELVFRKGYRRDVDSYGAFYENDHSTRTGLADYLRGRGFERVFVAGLARYGCVLQTALGARRDGFDVVMVDDASAGRPPDSDVEAGHLATIAEANIGWVDSTALVRAESAA
jgi:nicotinamidase/pyrazinamidase